MSPAMSALASVGITHEMLILAILAVVIAAVIGLFWHIIVPGAIVVVVGTLFINFTPVEKKEVVKEQPKKEEVFDERQAYLKDCVEVAEYSFEKCQKLWTQRDVEETVKETTKETVKESVEISSEVVKQIVVENHDSFKEPAEVKLINVDNAEYKRRRAEALSKPGAVVMQSTFR